MKRLIPTAILLVVVIVAFVYLKQNNFFSKQVDEKKPLITFNVGQVVDIQIQMPGEKIELGRENPEAEWKFVGSEPYPTKSEPIAYWLADFNRLENIGVVDDSDDQLGQFGLQRPSQSFRVQLADGSVHTLLLGDSLPVGTATYAKWAETPGVFKLTLADVQRLQKPGMEFVDKRPFQVSFDRLVRLTVSYRGMSWKLTKKTDPKEVLDSKWDFNGAELNYYQAADAISPFAFIKSDLELKPLAAGASESGDLMVEIEQVPVGTLDTSDRSQTVVNKHVGKIEGDQLVIYEIGGKYEFRIAVDAIKAAVEGPLKASK